MTPSEEQPEPHLDEDPEQDSKQEQQPGQLSEGGGALGDSETALAGADAIPDKTTGTAGDNRGKA